MIVVVPSAPAGDLRRDPGRARRLRAQSQTGAWPARQIRMIAPYPPGGGVDTVARAFSEKVAPKIGQTIVVDNQPGAGGVIGGAALARSPADGYTLMVGSMVDYSIAPYLPPGPHLRHGQGLRAHRRDRQRHGGRAGDAQPAGQQRPGADRARQVEARPALLRLVGLRRPDPSQLRDAEADDRRGDDPRALQGHDASSRPISTRAGCRSRSTTCWPICRTSPRARCAASPSPPRRARRCCPTCRPWPRRACRASNRPPTTRCSRPRPWTPISSRKLNATGNEAIRDADFRERMLKLGIVPVGGPQAEVAGQDAAAR